MQQIGIADTLYKINNTFDHNSGVVRSFGIRFLNSEGEARELTVRKYTKGARQQKRGTDTRGKSSYSLQKHGLVKFHDLSNSRIIDVSVALMYEFRDFESSEWQRIYH